MVFKGGRLTDDVCFLRNNECKKEKEEIRSWCKEENLRKNNQWGQIKWRKFTKSGQLYQMFLLNQLR